MSGLLFSPFPTTPYCLPNEAEDQLPFRITALAETSDICTHIPCLIPRDICNYNLDFLNSKASEVLWLSGKI